MQVVLRIRQWKVWEVRVVLRIRQWKVREVRDVRVVFRFRAESQRAQINSIALTQPESEVENTNSRDHHRNSVVVSFPELSML